MSKYSGKYSIPDARTANAAIFANTSCLLFSLPKNSDISIVVIVFGIIEIDNKGIRSTVSAYSGNTRGMATGAIKIQDQLMLQ